MLNYAPATGGQKQKSSTGAPWRLLVISLVLLILTVLITVGMEFGYKPYLTNQLQQADASITSLSQSLQQGQQSDVIGLYSRLYNINDLYTKHIVTSRWFAFFEKNILPTVRVTSMDADLLKESVKIDAIAPDMDTIVLQVATLQQDPQTQQVTLTSSQKQDPKEGTGFTFSLRVDLKDGWLTGIVSSTH
ncbi:MAG: hypothetical protein M1320_02045 [Patescibacteria group bacterium]|nr:hypothetical protein [Patescibacteria group bacterium]